MASFRNTSVNLLNLHYGIVAIVMTGGGAFYCVYLYKVGVPPSLVLVAMAAILLVRFAVRPAVVPLAVRFGLQRLVIAGAVLRALQFPVIATVHGVGFPLVALVAVSAVGDAVYWSSYHAYFAAVGDHEHRGHQIGAREALAAVVGVVSPLLTGSILVTFGAMAAFGASSAFMLASALPLLWTPNLPVAPRVIGPWKAAIPGILLFACDGWIGSSFVFVWQLALFQSLGESFVNFGGTLAVAALAGAVAALVLGRHIDEGYGARAVAIALGASTLVIFARAASPGHPAFAVLANTLASVSTCLYIPTLMTAVYNQAKRSPCALRFHVAVEGGWDAGGASGCLVAAAILWLRLPISAALLLPLVSVAALFTQLRRYYTAHSAMAEIGAAAAIGGAPSIER